MADLGPASRSEPDDWVKVLSSPGPDRENAIADLQALMVRAARYQVARMHADALTRAPDEIDDLVQHAADDATVSILAKLTTFEGRSKFTTWAYKFGILHAAVEVRRSRWKHREVTLDSLPEHASDRASPEQIAEASELSRAVTVGIDVALTPHQRRIMLALLLEEIPIDVLAERLGTTRNTLYKTLHDARVRLRRYLDASGHLTTSTSWEENS